MAKVMISLPDELLSRVDDEARRRGKTRSAFLAAAAGHEIERRDVHVLDEAIARSRRRFERSSPLKTASELVRAERELRP